MREFSSAATDFGMKVNFQKTKLMVASREVIDTDTEALQVGTEEIECVQEFAYLGSVVASSRRVDADVEKRIAQASRAFGALRRAIFKDRSLPSRPNGCI